MKAKALLVLMVLAACTLLAGCERKTVYDAKADPNMLLENAMQKVRSGEGGQYVLLQIGGDWCPWCMRLERFINEDAELDELLSSKFERVHIYYGKDQKNSEFLGQFGNPQGQGVPVLVLIDAKGQCSVCNMGAFEDGDGYSRERLLDFFRSYGEESIYDVVEAVSNAEGNLSARAQ